MAKIDRLKAKRDQKEDIIEYNAHINEKASNLVNEVFGGDNTGIKFHWFLPTSPVFPSSLVEDIYGFSVPVYVGEWTAVVDAAGDTYYWNSATDKTTWDPPPGFESNDIV